MGANTIGETAGARRDGEVSAVTHREFIGRQVELSRVRAGLGLLSSSESSFYLVFGPPGIGKSQFLSQIAREAASLRATVLWGKSWDAGGAPPYWPWVQAYRSFLGSIPPTEVGEILKSDSVPLIQLLDEWRGFLPGFQSPHQESDPDLARFRLFEAATQTLFRIASRNPTLLLLEDMHAADVPSLLLLRFLAGQLHDHPIMVLATYRKPALAVDTESALILEDLLREPVVIPIPLREFDEDEIKEFVSSRSGLNPSRQLVLGLKRRTQGNPLFLGKTIELLGPDAIAADSASLSDLHVEVPVGLRELIQTRIRSLPESAQTTFEMAVVLGEDVAFESLRRLGDLTAEQLLEFVGVAEKSGLLEMVPGSPGRFRFTHDLVRASAYEGLPPGRRAELHARAAQMLEKDRDGDSSAHLAELAYHYFEAVPLVDTGRAVEYLERAGDEAVKTLAYEEAVRLYRMGLSLLEGSERGDRRQMIGILLALADSEVKSGDLRSAKSSYLTAAGYAKQTGAVVELARAAVGYGGRFIFTRKGDDPHLVSLLQDALLLLGGEADALRVRLLGRLACALRGTEEPALLDNLSQQALDLARRIGDPSTLAYALAARVGAVWWPAMHYERLELSQELIGLAEQIGDLERVVDAYMMQMTALFELGDLVGVRKAAAVLDRHRDSIRQPSHEWLRTGALVMLATFEGEFERAEALVSALLNAEPMSSARDEVSTVRAQTFLLARHRGRLAGVESQTRAAAEEMPWYPMHRIFLMNVLADSGSVLEARAILEELTGPGLGGIPFDNYHILNLALLVEACDGLDEVARLPELYERLLPYSGMNTLGFPEGSIGAVDRYLGLAAFRLGDLDAADEYFRAAIRLNREMSGRPWLVLTQLDLARCLFKRDLEGDREDALRLVEEASVIASQIEMTLTGRARETAESAERSNPGQSESFKAISGVFRREGEYFTVSFGGTSSRMRDTKGLRYIECLLGSPGREFHALTLVSLLEGQDVSQTRVAPDEMIPAFESAGDVIDRKAIEGYKSRLVELETGIDEANETGDAYRAERMSQERDFIVSELSGATGLGGRSRTFTSASERARVSVTRAIRSAIRRLLDESPQLGQHLDATIRTGSFCSYRPDPAATPTWLL